MAEGDRFAELLSRVAREVTTRQASEICCGDLTLEQFQTLTAVSASDQLSIGSLSAQLRVDLSTMSRNVTLLERNGYLLRARSAEDGRIVQVTLTAKGKRALDTLRCGERDVLGDVYRSPAAGGAATGARSAGVSERVPHRRRTRKPSAACCAPVATPPNDVVKSQPIARPSPTRGRGSGRDRAAARDRDRLRNHGRAPRGRERRHRAAREHHRDRGRPGRADPDLRRHLGRALQPGGHGG